MHATYAACDKSMPSSESFISSCSTATVGLRDDARTGFVYGGNANVSIEEWHKILACAKGTASMDPLGNACISRPLARD